jgi:hypothetical protein
LDSRTRIILKKNLRATGVDFQFGEDEGYSEERE